MEDCLFCKIIAGDIPSSKVYEDDLCYAFNDIDPQAPTHFLVIPKQHIQSVAAVDASNSAVVAHCFEVIAKIAKERGMVGIKGHRLVGGFRASCYNALPKESVEALVACMQEFAQTHKK